MYSDVFVKGNVFRYYIVPNYIRKYFGTYEENISQSVSYNL